MSDSVGPIFIDTESQRQSHDIQKSIDAEVLMLLEREIQLIASVSAAHRTF